MKMLKLAERFLGKKCIIYVLGGGLGDTQIAGTIIEITDGAILVESTERMEAINAEYILRIREYPLNKKGKEKAFVAD